MKTQEFFSKIFQRDRKTPFIELALIFAATVGSSIVFIVFELYKASQWNIAAIACIVGLSLLSMLFYRRWSTLLAGFPEPQFSEERLYQLAQAVEIMQMGVTIANLDGEIVYTNLAEAEMHGYQVEELVGQDVSILAPPELRKPPTIVQIREWNGLVRESVNVKKDGIIFPVWLMSEIVKNAEGEPCAIVTSCEDITEREALEEERRRYRDQLEELVQERTVKLTTMNEQLQQEIAERTRAEGSLQQAKKVAETANHAKSEFLANMSHELRTPLNGILGYTQILQRDSDLSEKQREGIEVIHHSGEHLLMMISDILDLSKIEARKVELEPADFFLPDFLKTIVDITHIRAQQQGVCFDYEATSDLPRGVHGDEKRLRQVLLNLLSNAVKFTTEGEVVFRVKRVNELNELNELDELDELDELNELNELNELDELDEFKNSETQKLTNSQTHKLTNSQTHKLTNSQTHKLTNSQTHKLTNSQTHKLLFEVEDTGIGIAPDQNEHIFSAFHQVRDARVHSEGTGLGLAISQRLVRMMGGEIYVKSTIGQGSTFWFEVELPVFEDYRLITDVQPPEQTIIGFRGNLRRVLIADDHETNRAVLKDILVPLGFDVLETVNGRDMLNRAAMYHPELILIDLVMPVMDGFEATYRIRSMPELADIAIIAISASVADHKKQLSIASGCDAFLAKPFHIQELLDLIRIHLKVEWIYLNTTEAQFLEKDGLEESLIPPSQEELRELYDLAISGRLTRLRKHVETLEEKNPHIIPFAKKIRQYIKRFQIKEIQQFIQQFLEEKV